MPTPLRLSQGSDSPSLAARLRRSGPGLAVTAIGVAATLLVFGALRDRARGEQGRSFAKRAASVAAEVRSGLELPVEVLEGIRSLIASTPQLSSAEFARFVSSPLQRHTAITALEWAPVVPAQLRDAFESSARDQGLSGFRITEQHAGGTMEAAGVGRDVYVPILYMQPASDAVGFDIISEPGRRAIAWAARDSGQPTASGPFRLVEDERGVSSIAVYRPVYEHGARPESPKDRREWLHGFAIAVFRLPSLLERALPPERRADMELALTDHMAVGSTKLLYASRKNFFDELDDDAISWSTHFAFAGRDWELTLVRRTPFAPGIMPWLVLAAGLSASIFLGVGIGALGTIAFLRREVAAALELGQYTLVDKIGSGGMGTVYRAEHAMLRRPTAVKLLNAGGGINVKRFAREVQITSALTHPNTVAIYDYGRTPDGTFYYAMEYLEGMSLEELVQLDGAQPASRVVRILIQACGALAEAHAVGLIHRDIKPANLMLTKRGLLFDFLKVLDFGLVKKTEGTDAGVTSANAVVGTPLYLSPEAINDPESVDARSDLYALGAVAYYLLTGTDVFFGTSVVDICAKHLRTEPADMKSRGADVPDALEEIVLRCLAKSPKERPSSALELISALEALPIAAWTRVDAQRWWEESKDLLEKVGAERDQSSSDDEPHSKISMAIELRERGHR